MTVLRRIASRLLLTALAFAFLASPASGYIQGDMNDDNDVTLADAVLIMKFLAKMGVPPSLQKEVGVGDDQKIGLDDQVYVLQVVSSFRNQNSSPTAFFSLSAVTGDVSIPFVFDASGSSDPEGSIVDYLWDFGDGEGGRGVSLEHLYGAPGSYLCTLTVVDEGGARGVFTRWVAVTGRTEPPPDPSEVAPALDTTVATQLKSATEFLYTGPNSIQEGVIPDEIEAVRAAVLRGRVTDRDGDALAGVRIRVLDHPEFGQTLTREDGMFDLAVNGGKLLTVTYSKADYLTAQRQVNVPWQDWVTAPDVILIQLDAVVTGIDLTAPGLKVARGSLSSDSDGERRATLLFPEGITAEMVMPDGSIQPISNLSVRATEFTVGPNGPKAMPAELPPNVAYTYAVEFTVDEALAVNAREVKFTSPVIHYLENFLGFPVGTPVPAGYYDRIRGTWVASDSGQVIKILGITEDLADLDTDGNGMADNLLGIPNDERAQLASLYSAGQSLWRVPIPHFSPWDENWAVQLPEDATPPEQPLPQEKTMEDPCEIGGSIVECQNQVLGEMIPVTGTPFSLHYTSDRVPGRQAVFKIPLSGETIPDSLKRIDLYITIGGNIFKASYPAGTNLTHTFIWDGKDVYGRKVQGGQRLFARIGYVYDAVYARTVRFSSSGQGSLDVWARTEAILWQEMELPVYRFDASAQGLGGWTLSVHHTYDGGSGILCRGDGSRQSGESLNKANIIQTVVGSGEIGSGGDGGPALEAELTYPLGIALGPDGSIYIADEDSSVRRVGPDGIISTFAGQSGTTGFAGDGGPATEALLGWYLIDLALGPDGSLYILDMTMKNYRIRKVDPNGIISTVAGTGDECRGGDYDANKCGDGGPATEAPLGSAEGIDVGPDGSIYIAENGLSIIRRIGPDGIINTIVGKWNGYEGDGGPARDALIDFPSDVAVGPDGSLYIADTRNFIIRKVGIDGIIRTIAGIPGNRGFSGDGLTATESRLNYPKKLFIDSSDVLYVHDGAGFPRSPRIRRVWPAGIMDTLAGDGTIGFSGDLGPATMAQLNTYGLGGVAVGPDGGLYLVDESNVRIRKVSSTMPKLGISELVYIPSGDGTEIYEFDRNWRHMKTLHALTGAVLYRFGYDANGFLIRVTDGDGNITTIERQPNGQPAVIIGPYGHRTAFQLEANGYIASITNPAGEAVQFAYSDTGLMSRMTDGRGNIHSFHYDALGRLTLDENPAGGFLALERAEQSQGFEVETRTALDRVTTYQTEYLPSGQKIMINAFPTGAQTVSVVETDGSEKVDLPDDMSIETVPGGDPRFGLMAPMERSRSVMTPSGLTFNQTMNRTVTLANPYDPLTITSQTDVFTLNGKTYNSITDVSARRVHFHTPEGRSTVTGFDEKGRLLSLQTGSLEAFIASYDSFGRPVRYSHGDMTFSLTYNPQGKLSGLTDAAGQTTEYVYDAADRVREIRTPLGHSYFFDYDGNGNQVQLTTPNGKIHGLAYNAHNLLSGYTPPYTPPETPLSYSFIYDTEKYLTRMGLPGGRTVDFAFDAGGRLSQIQYPEATVEWRYADSTDRFFQVERSPAAGSPQQIQYDYDGALRTSTTFSGAAAGTYIYTYDSDFLLTGIHFASGADSLTIPLVRDNDGLLTGYGNFDIVRDAGTGRTAAIGDDGSGTHKLQINYTYDALGRLSGRIHTVNGTQIYSFQLGRDNTGRITRRIDDSVNDYEYNLDGQLTKVMKDELPVELYTYDRNANRTSTLTAAAYYDEQDRITDQGGVDYQHDADGFMIRRGADTMVYSAQGELLQATVGGTTVDYAYDGFSRRVGRKVSSGIWHQYFYGNPYNPYLVTATRDVGGVLTTYVYDDFSHLVAFQRGTDWYYTATDQVGTPVVVSDADGNIVKTLEYDSYGVLIADSNPGFELSVGFAGGIDDPVTGLVRFGSRDYDPAIGRWTARDKILFDGGQFNLYAYVFNNPVTFRDPGGAADEDGFGIFEALYALFEGRSPGGPYDREREREYDYNRRWREDWKEKGWERCQLAQRKKELEKPLLVDVALGINELITEGPKVASELLKGIGLIKVKKENVKQNPGQAPHVVGGGMSRYTIDW